MILSYFEIKFELNAIAIIGDIPPAPVVMFLILLAGYFPQWTPFFMPNPISPSRIWKNEEVIKHMISERNQEMRLGIVKKFCLGTALGLLRAVEAVRETAIPGLDVPFFVAHGTSDYGVPIAGSEYLLKHAKTPEEDRCVEFIKDGFHDLFSDDLRESILQTMVNWMDSRIGK